MGNSQKISILVACNGDSQVKQEVKKEEKKETESSSATTNNLLQLPTRNTSGAYLTITLINYDLHCYLPLSVFGVHSNCP